MQVQTLDAITKSAFVKEQLEHVFSKVYEKKHPELKCRTHIPTDFEAGPAVENVSFDIYEDVGMAKIVAANAGDWPRVDVVAKRHTSQVVSLGDEYAYTFQDVRRSMATGRNLSERKAMVAKKGIMRAEDYLAYMGDSDAGQLGLLTYPTTPRILSDISITDPTIANNIKLQRLNYWAKTPRRIAEFEVTACLMAPSEYEFLESTARSDQSDTFLMDLFRKSNPNINFVDWCSHCEGAGINGSNVMIFYVRDPDYVILSIPSDFEQLEPDFGGRETIISCHERFAGIQMIQPLSAVIVENL